MRVCGPTGQWVHGDWTNYTVCFVLALPQLWKMQQESEDYDYANKLQLQEVQRKKKHFDATRSLKTRQLNSDFGRTEEQQWMFAMLTMFVSPSNRSRRRTRSRSLGSWRTSTFTVVFSLPFCFPQLSSYLPISSEFFQNLDIHLRSNYLFVLRDRLEAILGIPTGSSPMTTT